MNMNDDAFDSLSDVIPDEVWSKFDFGEYYDDEDKILKPYLESQGFTCVRFAMGERDSFGPLSRICLCKDKTGKSRQFIYG